MYGIYSITILTLILGAIFAQEGRKFIVSFPPDLYNDDIGYCQIIITTDSQSEVSIMFHDFTDHLTLGIGSHTYNTDCTIRAQSGHSNKAVIVESDKDILVQVYSVRYAWGDAFLALPTQNSNKEYILATPPGPCREGQDITSLFTIAAELNNTSVDIYAPSSEGYVLVYSVNLNRFGTYTNSTTSTQYMDYTGWKIASRHPVSVVTGSSCYVMNVGTCSISNAGYMSSHPIVETGLRFIVPKISKLDPGDSGALIRVISSAQNNLIQLPDQSILETLNTGDYFLHYIRQWDNSTRVECSKQCTVVLYNEVRCRTGEGGFLMNITPLEHSTNHLRFTAIEKDGYNFFYDNFLTIIGDTKNVTLDNEVLTGWREVPEWGFNEVAVSLDGGAHTLESTDNGTFVAFVYGHRRAQSHGYGLELVYEGLGKVTTDDH